MYFDEKAALDERLFLVRLGMVSDDALMCEVDANWKWRAIVLSLVKSDLESRLFHYDESFH